MPGGLVPLRSRAGTRYIRVRSGIGVGASAPRRGPPRRSPRDGEAPDEPRLEARAGLGDFAAHRRSPKRSTCGRSTTDDRQPSSVANPGAASSWDSLATGIVDGRAMAEDPAASLSASFRRAAARARGSLVSVRVPDGLLAPGPYAPPRPGRFGPSPLMAPFVDRPTDGDGRDGLLGPGDRCRQGHHPHRRSGRPRVRRNSSSHSPTGSERLTSQIRRDPRSGLALLVVDMQGLHPAAVSWGDPAKLEAGRLADRAGAAGRRRPVDVGGRLQHPASGRRRGTARDRRGDHPGRRRRDPDQPERRGRRDLQAGGPARGRVRGHGPRHPRRSGASGRG